jgi:hypothetical protein
MVNSIIHSTTKTLNIENLTSFIHINDYSINVESPYGDGYSSKKICDIFEKLSYEK